MPFNRATLQQIESRVQSDIESRLPGTDPRLRNSVLSIIARAVAGAVHSVYGYLDWQARQLLPDTSDAEGLDRQASLWKILRKAAAAATGNITFTGTNGTVIPAGTQLQRADGALYTTNADATIAAGTATVAVTASTPGFAGNAIATSTLTLTTPISGVNSMATVATGGLAGGADIEADDALRARLLERIQAPPHGGTDFDYVSWAKEVAGVTRAWVSPLASGPSTVTVRFMTDDLTANGIPDGAKVTEVQSYINARRPVTAAVAVAAPTPVVRNFTVHIVPDTSAVRAAVEAELRDMLRREAEPGGTILLSHIREAVSIAAGETDSTVSVPAADVTHTAGQIAVMGVITWV